MKLILHTGLHKTGSTYLQHVLNDNHAQLAARGVWYQPQQGYPAHHPACRQVLTGSPDPLVEMATEARAADCDTLLFSSEDLEGALYDDLPLASIGDAMQVAGIEAVEWQVVLREPGAAFASLFAQLQHHVYVDAFQLFYDVMHRGFIHMTEPMPGMGTPYWYYAFDHAADLEKLAERTDAPVFAHDFAALAPFPGAGILRHLGVLDAVEQLPGDAARNARPSQDAMVQGVAARVEEAVPDGEAQAEIVDGFLTCVRNGLESVPSYASIIGKTYAQSHAEALKVFAPEEPAEA